MKKKRGPEEPASFPEKKPQQHGSPPHIPTPQSRQQVEVLCGLGLTQEEIGLVIDLSESALKKHYAKELRVGGLKADATVLTNLYRMATGNGPEAGKTAIFWAKVRRRWHEVQRVIHGYDPETINTFVKGVVSILRRELPKQCPHCKTQLDLPQKIAVQLQQMSDKLAEKLPPSEIVPMPRPQLASDDMETKEA